MHSDACHQHHSLSCMFCVQIDRGKQAEAECLHITHLEQELVLEVARAKKELAATQAYKVYCNQQMQAAMIAYIEAREKVLDEAMALPEYDADLVALFN